MKNFYEATVTKPKLTLRCCLGIKRTHGNVRTVIKINNENVFGDNSTGETKIIADHQLWVSVPLDQPLDISIQLIDRQHPDALEVSLTVDGYEVLPKYQHLASQQTCYIDTNDIWQLNIPSFYPWYHEVSGQGWIV
jgi:hypothetical protein